MDFETVSLSVEGPERPDQAHPEAFWSDAQARLLRGGHVSARWLLLRVRMPGHGAKTLALILPEDPMQPPAGPWTAKLREMALAQAWCEPGDAWAEAVRSGWAAYGFNRIQERGFSDGGGSFDEAAHGSWPELCEALNLPLTLLAGARWDGLAPMWGEGFERAWSRREAIILERGLQGDGSQAGEASGKARGRGRILKA